MTRILCETCGTEFGRPLPPDVCPICSDERQYVGWQGQRWTTMEALARVRAVRLEEDDGLLGIGIAPSFAINQRALVIPAKGVRVLWECTSLVSDEAVARLKAEGGIDLIAISHPHFYAAMMTWSEALGGVPILLHEADAEWIACPSPVIEFWSGDSLALSGGVTLLRCGGHFPGSTALHWQDERRPEGALFSGDALQVVQNRRAVSFMYSYPNLIPMRPSDVGRMRHLLADLRFEDVYGFTWGRNIVGGGRAATDRSFDRYLAAVAS